ncbi:MAG: porin [Nitrospira sp.]|nr:porin [Nitrospira sp.]
MRHVLPHPAVRMTAWLLGLLLLGFLFARWPTSAWAVEEGELVKSGGRWHYSHVEDPGLKYLLQKGIISQEEYDRGARIIESRQHLATPTSSITTGDGLNIKSGDKFLLKLRMLLRFRYSYHQYNQAWRTVGDGNNMPDYTTGPSPISAKQSDSSASTFGIRTLRLQFLGYAFDPDLRYNLTLTGDTREGNYNGSTVAGTVQVLDANVSSWHLPYAILRIGQQKVWFNRESITSIATISFVERSPIADAFTANGLNLRDQGITLQSDEAKYPVNYAIGVYNGTGINTDRLAMPLTSSGSGARANANEMMYVGRLLWNVSGRPGYGEGDILYTRVPQVALAIGYAYNPGLNLQAPNAQVRAQILGNNNGRLFGVGYVDLATTEVDVVAKYRGWGLQAEGYLRRQDVRGGNAELGMATGWYVMLGKFVIPRKLEVAVRYGIMDPNTHQGRDLLKDAGVAVNYSFDGTYNHRLVVDYSHITMGTGGYAGGRSSLAAQPGYGKDLIENRVRAMYQFYW